MERVEIRKPVQVWLEDQRHIDRLVLVKTIYDMSEENARELCRLNWDNGNDLVIRHIKSTDIY